MVMERPFGLKRVFFDRIFQHSYWSWRKHPAIIVPTMLGSGLSAIAQSIITLAAILVLANFAVRSTLFGFLSTIAWGAAALSPETFKIPEALQGWTFIIAILWFFAYCAGFFNL